MSTLVVIDAQGEALPPQALELVGAAGSLGEPVDALVVGSGVRGLAISMPVAGALSLLIAGPSLSGEITPGVLLAGVGLALLVPVIPFSLEMLALRRLSTAAFGTLMCLEPALALIAGVLLLHQRPRAWALVGVAFWEIPFAQTEGS